MKSVQIRSYFWSVFSCIRTEYGDLLRSCIRTEYGDLLRKSPYSVSVNLRIQSECRKIRTRKTPYLDNFHAVGYLYVHYYSWIFVTRRKY